MMVSCSFLLCFASILRNVFAHPSGAGQCLTGMASPSHGSSTSGTLEAGGYNITIDGKEANSGAATVTANTEFTIDLSGPSFLGFLIYLPDFADTAVNSVSAGQKLATLSSCQDKAAVTHSEAVGKTSVSTSVTLSQVGVTKVDLNIVVEKEIYYYTQVTLTVAASAPAEPTMAPIQSPSTSPSAVPSDAPVDNNGNTPVEPAAAPIQSPSTSPSALPSSAPVKDDDNGSNNGGSSCRASSLRLFCKG